jgi:hypothetical protein
MADREEIYAKMSEEELLSEIEKLNKQMSAFAHDGLYQKADANLKVIEELKKCFRSKRVEEVNAQQELETRELIAAFDLLKVQFNSLWEEEINKFDLESSRQILSMEVYFYGDAYLIIYC